MVVSCILLLDLLLCLIKQVRSRQERSHPWLEESSYSWHLDDTFVLLGTLIHVLSLGSSSMVEEEQYTCHFLVSTMYLIFLLKAVPYLSQPKGSGSAEVMENGEQNALHQLCRTEACSSDRFYQLKNMKAYRQILSILIVLVCGRLLRGWHQGGVNWVDLPDISKWLEQAGVFSIKSLQIISLLFLIILNSYSIGVIRSRTILVDLVIFSHLSSGLLVCFHIVENWDQFPAPDNHISTLVAQIFYLTISMTVVLTALSSPWVMRIRDYHLMAKPNKDSHSINTQIDSLLVGISDSMYLIGITYTASWCLLQFLLQQPINTVPALLVFLQLLASIIYFSADGSCHGQWVEVSFRNLKP